MGGAVQAQQSVSLQGMLGGRALLIVDGTAPKAVAVRDSHRGVTVLSTHGDEAMVEFSNGRRQVLRVGEAPASVGGGSAAPSGNRIVLAVGSGGHFMSQGAINGRATRFMVDTGATAIALDAGEAERLGIDFRSGQPVRLSTANGVAAGWAIRLMSVRVGEVEVHNVEAVVSPQPMPFVLLGNSFLNRFQMRRDSDQMVLERRY